MIKDKLFIGSEFLAGKTIYLPEKSDSLNFIDYADGEFIFHEKLFIDYIRAMKNAGVNAWRSLPWYFEPVDIEKKEETARLDSKEFFLPHEWISDNKWDLSAFDPKYFEIFVRMAEIILDGGNTVLTYPIIDNCANMEGYGSWAHNINGVSGIYDEKAMVFIHKLIDKLLLEFGSLKENIIFELGNEIHNAEFAFNIFKYLIEKGIKPEMICLGINLNLSPETSEMKVLRERIVKEYNRDFLRHTFFPIHQLCIRSGAYAHKSGFGKHVHWSMNEPKGSELGQSEAAWMQRIISDQEQNDIRVFISTDGTGDGDSILDIHPRPSAKYRQRPSWQQIEKFLELIFSKYKLENKFGLQRIYFEQFIKIQSLSVQQPFFESLSNLYQKYFDTKPYNYGKFEQLEDEVIVIEEPEPEVIEPEIIEEEIIMDKGIISFSKKFPYVHIKLNVIWSKIDTNIQWGICAFLVGFIAGAILL